MYMSKKKCEKQVENIVDPYPENLSTGTSPIMIEGTV